MARIHPFDALQRRPRLPDDLADRIDAARGDVTFTRWVVRACELRLAGTLEAATGNRGSADTGVTTESLGDARLPSASSVPSSPRAPRKPRAPKVASEGPRKPLPIEKVVEQATSEPPEEPTPADQESPSPEMPSAVQLMNKAGVTLSMARRWQESGEWAMYWP